jgi:hypothetical protein
MAWFCQSLHGHSGDIPHVNETGSSIAHWQGDPVFFPNSLRWVVFRFCMKKLGRRKVQAMDEFNRYCSTL